MNRIFKQHHIEWVRIEQTWNYTNSGQFDTLQMYPYPRWELDWPNYISGENSIENIHKNN